MSTKARPTALKLNAAVQEPPTDGGANKTGFPEPLSPHRNTTLPHPSADTSPNACIEASDVPLSRTHSRVSSRHSFGFGHRHKSSRADGPIDMSAFPATVAGRVSVESSIEEVLNGNAEGKGLVVTEIDGYTVVNGENTVNGNGNMNGDANGLVKSNGTVQSNGISLPDKVAKEDGGDEDKDSQKKKGGLFRKLHLHH